MQKIERVWVGSESILGQLLDIKRVIVGHYVKGNLPALSLYFNSVLPFLKFWLSS